MDRRTDQSGGPGGTSRTAVTSRGLVDDELDDLELEVAEEDDAEDKAPSSAKSSPSASTRKTAARKTTGNGNGRTSTASAKAKAAAASAKDDVADADAAVDSAESPTQEFAIATAAVDTGVVDTGVVDSGAAETSAAATGTAAVDAALKDAASTDAAALESAAKSVEPPAMPADDIWTQRVAKPAVKPADKPVAKAASKSAASVDDWAPMEASQRLGGNVYDVTDVYSAPPMPSDPYTTPVPSSTGRPSFTPSSSPSSRSSASASSAAYQAPPRTPASPPPAQAFPRPAGTAKPAPPAVKPAPASKVKAKTSVRRSQGRQAHLTIARIEPWSVMKFSFATSLVAFVILFVAVAVLYGVLSALGVFDSLQHLVANVTSSKAQAGYNAHTWFSASRVLTYTVLLGVINVVLITALSTIGAVIYNLTSRLIGGVEVTLRETD